MESSCGYLLWWISVFLDCTDPFLSLTQHFFSTAVCKQHPNSLNSPRTCWKEHEPFPRCRAGKKSQFVSRSVCLAPSAADSVDYDLFMEGTTQEGGSRSAVGEQEGKSWQDRIDKERMWRGQGHTNLLKTQCNTGRTWVDRLQELYKMVVGQLTQRLLPNPDSVPIHKIVFYFILFKVLVCLLVFRQHLTFKKLGFFC